MTSNDKTPMTFWLISGAALIWNLFGLMVYVSTVSATPEELIAQFGEDGARFISSIPVWATSANAIAVTAGVLASLLLLLRRSLALPMFVASFVALLVQDLYSFVLNDVTAVLGDGPLVIQSVVMIIAIALLLYTWRLGKKGALK